MKVKTAVTSNAVTLGVHEEYHHKIRSMFNKHETMWEINLEESHATEHRIGFKEEDLQFRSAPFTSGPKSREL